VPGSSGQGQLSDYQRTHLELAVNLVHGSNVQFDLVHGCDEESHYLCDQLAGVSLGVICL
jgi:hypothetical protein